MFFKRARRSKNIVNIRVDRLFPSSFSPRRDFDGEDALCESIRENGVTEPLTVKLLEKGKYSVISGERRLRAAKTAGLTRVPCVVVRQSDEKAAVTRLLHDISHKSLNIFEEADGIYTLISRYGIPRDEAAARLGLSENELVGKLRLLSFTHWQREKILALGLSERKVKSLLKISDEERRDGEIFDAFDALSDQDAFLKSDGFPRTDSFSKPQKPPLKRQAVGDGRIISNTISNAVESIRKAGITALSERTESDGFVEYRITLPKNKKAD